MKPSPRIMLPTSIINDERIITAEAMMPEYSDNIAGIVFKLLCYTAENEGYFLPWDNDRTIAVTIRKAGIRTDFQKVCHIVDELVNQDFFSKEVFDDCKVLVCDHLQDAYLKAVSRRRNVQLNVEYIIVDIPDSLMKTEDVTDVVQYQQADIAVNQPIEEDVKPIVQKEAEPKQQHDQANNPPIFKPTPIPKPVTRDKEEVFLNEIQERKFNLECLAKVTGISVDEVYKLIDVFKEHCRANATMHSSSNHCYSHFANWVRVYVTKGREMENKNNSGYAQQQNNTAVYGRAAERKREEQQHDTEFQSFIGRLMAESQPYQPGI